MNASIVCPVCGRPAHNATICRTCQRGLRTRLVRLPALLAELDTTACKRDRVAPPSEVRGGDVDPPLPFKPKAARQLAATRLMLRHWVREVADTQLCRTVPTHEPDTLLCRTLTAHMPDIRRHPDAPTLVDTITRHTRTILQLIDTPTVKARFQIGPCPEATDDGTTCGGQVWAWIPAEPSLRPVAQCNTCEHQWSAEQWARLGDLIKQAAGRQQAVATLARALAHRKAT